MSNTDDIFDFHALIDALNCNREIEFQYNGTNYFAEPHTTPKLGEQPCYEIWDCDKHICMFIGFLDKLLEFHFPGGASWGENFDSFDFLYIL